MSDHGFSVCGIYATYSARLVGVVIDDTLPTVSWLHALDHCGTRWLKHYSPPPPWRWYLDARIRGSHVGWWRDRLPYLEWWFANMCREVDCDYCAASGETDDE